MKGYPKAANSFINIWTRLHAILGNMACCYQIIIHYKQGLPDDKYYLFVPLSTIGTNDNGPNANC